MRDPLVILGASGHAVVLAQAAEASGRHVVGHLADRPSTCGLRHLGDESELGVLLSRHPGLEVALGIGDNHARRLAAARLERMHPGLAFATIIHPSAAVCGDGSVGRGAFVAAAAVVAAGAKVGAFAILNTRASLDHHSSLGDFASMAPASATGGNAVIGSGAHVGMGAMVHHGVTIGDDAVLGSLALANKDVPARTIWVGNPARQIKVREPGEPYL